jgi:hypothetical protein
VKQQGHCPCCFFIGVTIGSLTPEINVENKSFKLENKGPKVENKSHEVEKKCKKLKRKSISPPLFG